MVNALMTDAGFLEIMRNRPIRLGAEDPTRMHVVFERAQKAGETVRVASVSF